MVDYLHFKKEITPEEKEQFGNMLEEKGKKSIEKQGAIKSYEITSEEISEDGTTAKVDYIIKHEDGKESSQSINLVNIDGKWLIDSEK